MGAQRLTRRQRAEVAVRSVESRLPKALAGVVGQLVSATPPTVVGLLRAWRKLGRVADLTPHDRAVLRQGFVNAFARLLHEKGSAGAFTPADFGVRGHRELAELFLTTLDRVGYAKAGPARLRRMRSMVVGELLEVLVRNAAELQAQLLGAARAQLGLLRSPGAKLVHAAGKRVTVTGLGAPLKAMNMVIIGPGGHRKFIDFAYVSLGELPDGTRCLSLLVEIEIKMPTAARKAGGQIGRAQVRLKMSGGDRLLVDVEGHGPLEFRTGQIVFLPSAIDRTLVTIGATENFRLRTTRAGGYDEAFWQVDMAMRAESLRTLVDLAVPR